MDEQSQQPDAGLERRIDNIIEEEVRRGFRCKSLPADLLAVLTEAHELESTVAPFQRVRFTKLTPKKKQQINGEVIKRYHPDIKSNMILSSAELRKLAIERGEWSVAEEQRLEFLREETNRLMRELYNMGFSERQTWAEQLTVHMLTARAAFEAGLNDAGDAAYTESLRAMLVVTFDRWVGWSPQLPAEQQAAAAKAQGLDPYNEDQDLMLMRQHAPTAEGLDALLQADDLRYRIRKYVECVTMRQEMLELEVKRGKILAESVEQRRDTVEEMARLYYCTEVVDAQDMPQGRLAKTFDLLWDLPDEIIQWLLVEMFFFIEGTPDVAEAREFLEQWGFIAAPRQTSASATSAPSVASPGEQSSSIASPLSEVTSADSKGSTALTTLVTTS